MDASRVSHRNHALIRRTKSAPSLLARCGSSRYCWRAAGAVATLHQMSGVRSTSCGCQSRLLYMLSRHFTTSSALVNAVPVPLVVAAQGQQAGLKRSMIATKCVGAETKDTCAVLQAGDLIQAGGKVYTTVCHSTAGLQLSVSCICCCCYRLVSKLSLDQLTSMLTKCLDPALCEIKNIM